VAHAAASVNRDIELRGVLRRISLLFFALGSPSFGGPFVRSLEPRAADTRADHETWVGWRQHGVSRSMLILLKNPRSCGSGINTCRDTLGAGERVVADVGFEPGSWEGDYRFIVN
jgi:hypothetical protein